jgi:hypothetical protein
MEIRDKARASGWAVLIIVLFVSLSISGCDDDPPERSGLTDLEMQILEASAWADMMPGDPSVNAQVHLAMENTSADRTLTELDIPWVIVYLRSADENIGTIQRSTAWEGILHPGQRDTLELWFRNTGEFPLGDFTWATIRNLCNEFVQLEVEVQSQNEAAAVKSGSVLFPCWE